MLELTEDRRESLLPLVSAWLARRGVEGARTIEVVEVEVLLAGRPGLLDVVARVDGRVAHLVVGLHGPRAEIQMLGGADDGVLGELEDDRGPVLAVNALWDAEMAPLLTIAIVGEEPGVVSVVRDDDTALVLDIEGRCTFSVFPWLTDAPHPAVEMLVTLDEVGFNHLAAPVALWRRQGRDLGIVQEMLMGGAGGWALALTSLRDLYGSGVRPEEAGGDFAFEARSLGTMAARMHLASDKAFGRQHGSVADWTAGVESAVGRLAQPLLRLPGSADSLRALRNSTERAAMVRTHGDFHLGRTARTDQGWVVADWLPGGVDAAGAPLFRSPLADVADLLWSLHHVAKAALDERDPALRPGLEPTAAAWEERNRRAFLAGYLRTPGIEDLVPSDHDVVRELTAAFELAQSAIRPD
jgi:predicted trehalose synthase